MAITKLEDFFAEKVLRKLNEASFANGNVRAGMVYKGNLPICKAIIYAGDINMDIIFSKMIIFEEIPGDVRKLKDLETFMCSESVWTCECSSNYLHTKLITLCPRCKCPLEKQTYKLKSIPKSLFEWGDLFLDASKYDVPKEFEDA